MNKLTYKEFLKNIDDKELTLLKAGFYQNSIDKPRILEFFDGFELYEVTPINTGVVTVRSNDFYRTMQDGKQSFASKMINTDYFVRVTDNGTYFCILSPTNYIFYRMEK